MSRSNSAAYSGSMVAGDSVEDVLKVPSIGTLVGTGSATEGAPTSKLGGRAKSYRTGGGCGLGSSEVQIAQGIDDGSNGMSKSVP